MIIIILYNQVQYKFLHHCLNEILTLGSTVVALGDVPAFLNSSKFIQRTQQEYEVQYCALYPL